MFPVLLQVLPAMSLMDWTAFATDMIRRSNADGGVGVVAIETENGTIRGGFIYEVESDRQQQRRLVVRHIAIPALGQGLVAEAIHLAVEEIARTQSCAAVDVELPTEAAWEASYFAGRGHAVRIIALASALSLALR